MFLEDPRAKILLEEILVAHKMEILPRIKLATFGAASVGKALGQMVAQERFPRPTVIFLDGDQEEAVGCHLLPGQDAPEIVVFGGLKDLRWVDVARVVNRSHSDLVDYAEDAMTQPDHHRWPGIVADRLIVGGDELWRAMCRVWVANNISQDTANRIVESIDSLLD
ncbi:hypothetical protein OL229_03605 [Neisseriaceae bacterium JH1-16]|nr:hypothetical protein [Neisseriaceae bacterium JH1-16]